LTETGLRIPQRLPQALSDAGIESPAARSRILIESTFPASLAARLIHLQKVLTVPDKPKSVTYADAGVDISSGDRAKERIKYLAQKTFNRNVLGGIGGFGGLFRLDMQRWKNPIL